MHVQKDNFSGHPDGLKWDPDFAGKPITIEQMRELRVPPAVYIPHGVLGTSAETRAGHDQRKIRSVRRADLHG